MVKFLPKTEGKSRPTNLLIPISINKRSLIYRKLPEQLLRLSVLKLDGALLLMFVDIAGFHVARNATVGSLKLAIEEEFSISQNDERKRLWCLAWSHFCLCYEGQKLLSERACITKYGIKDGDQLHFIHHLRTDIASTPQQFKNQSAESKQCSVPNALDDREAYCGEDLAFLVPKSNKLRQSLKELLSCSKSQHPKRSWSI